MTLDHVQTEFPRPARGLYANKPCPRPLGGSKKLDSPYGYAIYTIGVLESRVGGSIPYSIIPYHTIPYHTIPYHTIPYHTIPYHTIPYQTIPYHTIPYHTIPYHTIPYHTILYYTILSYPILSYPILYYTILYYTILYYTILYYTILYYTILYYTTLHCNRRDYTILYYADTIPCHTILYHSVLDPPGGWGTGAENLRSRKIVVARALGRSYELLAIFLVSQKDMDSV